MPSRKPRVSPKKSNNHGNSEKPNLANPTWSHPDYSGPYMSTDKKYYQPIPKEAFPKPAGSVRYGTFCDRCKTVDLYEKRMEWVRAVKESTLEVAFTIICAAWAVATLTVFTALVLGV